MGLLLAKHLWLDYFQLYRLSKSFIGLQSVVFKDENIKRSLGVTAHKGHRVPESLNRDVHFEQLSPCA